MNTPKAILIGFALVAAAVYFSRDVGPAQAALGSPDYLISGGAVIWVMDSNKRKIRWCVNSKPPECSSWVPIDK